MDSILSDLFGGQGGNQEQQARNFVQQFEQGGNVSDQAVQHYQQAAQQVPPDVYQRAAEQAFAQLSPQQREQFLQTARQQVGNQGIVSGQTASPDQLAKLATQIHQNQPGGLASIFGGGQSQGGQGGGLQHVFSNPLAKVVLGGIAAMAVKHALDNRSSSSSGHTLKGEPPGQNITI